LSRVFFSSKHSFPRFFSLFFLSFEKADPALFPRAFFPPPPLPALGNHLFFSCALLKLYVAHHGPGLMSDLLELSCVVLFNGFTLRTPETFRWTTLCGSTPFLFLPPSPFSLPQIFSNVLPNSLMDGSLDTRQERQRFCLILSRSLK